MNNQIKEEGLTDAYLLGKYDGIKQGRADTIETIKAKAESLKTSPCPQGCTCENEPEGCLYVMALNDMITYINTLGGNQ